jgi:hypothetical protein
MHRLRAKSSIFFFLSLDSFRLRVLTYNRTPLSLSQNLRVLADPDYFAHTCLW